jgi:LptD protein
VGSIDSNGKEKLEPINIIDALNVAGSYNMLADSFNWSDIRAGMNTVLLKFININMDASFSPYAVNEKKQRINKYAWKENKQPLHFQTFRTSLNTRLSPETFKKSRSEKPTDFDEEDEGEMKDIASHPEDYYNLNIPWNLSLNYIIEFNNNALEKSDRFSTNRIAVNGEISITPEWKVGYTSGYDLVRKEITSSQFNITRNLHCWQIDFSWVPSGYFKQWVFTLRPKSSLLQDLKLNKRTYSSPQFF